MTKSPLLYCNNGPLLDSPLWWHKLGLQQTASGYGSKLTNSFKTWFQGRWRRVYTMCWSDSGTCYIIVKGQKLILANTVGLNYVTENWQPESPNDYTQTFSKSYVF